MSAKAKFTNCLSATMKFVDEITDNHVFAYAAQASFFVIISAVPCMMIIINILQAFLPVSQEYFEDIIYLLPTQIQSLANGVVGELYQNVSVPLVSITTLFLIWTTSRGVQAISSGLRVVFKTNKDSNYLKTIGWSLVYTLVLMVSIVICAVAIVFGKDIADLAVNYIPAFRGVIDLIIELRYIVLFIFFTLVFMSAYRFLGKSKLRLRKHFVGAALASGAWLIISYIYSLYIQNISGFSYIYGSLTAVIFLMLWLWICMISLLFGAEVVCFLNDRNITVKSAFEKFIRKR